MRAKKKREKKKEKAQHGNELLVMVSKKVIL